MTARPRSSRSRVLGLMVVALMTLSACGGGDTTSTDSGDQPTQTSSTPPLDPGAPPEAPEPDLEGIPEVVAVVNGESISREDFEQVYTRQFQATSAQAQTTGQPVDQEALKEQTLDGLVGNELLIQAADRRNIAASDADVETELADLLAQNGLDSREDLTPLLAQQGLSLDDVLEQIEVQIKIDRLIERVTPGALKVTRQEVRAFYDQVAQQQQANPQSQELPPLSEIRGEVEDQLRTEKEGEAAQALVADFRQDAEITVNL